MALPSWSNSGLSSLASAIDAVQTSLTLLTGTGSRFPSANFPLRLWDAVTFPNPIDDPNNEIVLCTSRTGDVCTVTRAQEGTSGVSHAAGDAVILPVTKDFRDQLQSGHEIDGNPKWKSGTSFSGELDHANTAARTYKMPNRTGEVKLDANAQFEFLEDFAELKNALTETSGADNEFRYHWRNAGTVSGLVAHTTVLGGVFRYAFTAQVVEAFSLFDIGTGALAKLFNASKNPTLRLRFAQDGTIDVNAGNECRIGLAGQTLNLTAEPTDGIYIRHLNNGNIIAVARASSTESTLDTGVATASGVFHTVTMEVRGGNTVVVSVDGVEKGTISSNVPTVDLGLSAGIGDTPSGTKGFRMDHFHVVQER